MRGVRLVVVAVGLVTACVTPHRAPAPPTALVVGSGSASPPPVASSAPVPDPVFVRPCAPGPERDAAIAKLDDLEPKIRNLTAADDPSTLVAELNQVLASSCFALALEDFGAPVVWPDALTLRTWWNLGGYDYLRGYAQLDITVPPMVGTAPAVRRSLTDSNRRPDEAPLAPLLCPLRAVHDASCGRETLGWALRADSAFRRALGRSEDSIGNWCADHLGDWREGPTGQLFSPYAAFRTCLDDLAETREALPLGAFRAPVDGWFFVTQSAMISLAGCQERLAAYDLATGAAYLHRCTPHKHPATVHVGRVPVAAIREAAWMTMLRDVVQRDVRERARWYRVPAGIVIERKKGERVPARRASVHVDDATVRGWTWMRKDGTSWKGQLSGRFEVEGWGAATHAYELLEVADASFTPGCAPAPPPKAIPWEHLGPSLGEPTERIVESFAFYRQAATAISAASASASGSSGPCAPLP